MSSQEIAPAETPIGACPKCGHSDEEHRRESWYDEEGIEGMTCDTCADQDKICAWWTWDWSEVLAETVAHEDNE